MTFRHGLQPKLDKGNAMQEKGRATPEKEAALKQIRDQFSGVSRVTQRLRLRAVLNQGHTVTTNEARDGLDIMHPAGRIKELRDEGLCVLTLWETVEADNGDRHRIAKYLLVRGGSDA